MNKWHWDNRERMIVSAGGNHLSTEDFIMYTNGLERGLKYSRQLAKSVTLELAALLERLAGWTTEAVIAGYAEDYSDHKDDVTVARTLAAGIREALALEENDEN